MDIVNNPRHYTLPCSRLGKRIISLFYFISPSEWELECIDVMDICESRGARHALLNAFEYLWRYLYKGSPGLDLHKATFYLERLKSQLGPDDAMYCQIDAALNIIEETSRLIIVPEST